MTTQVEAPSIQAQDVVKDALLLQEKLGLRNKEAAELAVEILRIRHSAKGQ